MKIVRLVLGVLITIFLLTLIVESIEFLLVKTVSGKSFEELTNNQKEYFGIRNQWRILVLKIIYTFLGAFAASWVGIMIVKHKVLLFFKIIIAFQLISFIYAMFFSEYKDTLPIYYWLLLLITVLLGFYTTYFKSIKRFK